MIKQDSPANTRPITIVPSHIDYDTVMKGDHYEAPNPGSRNQSLDPRVWSAPERDARAHPRLQPPPIKTPAEILPSVKELTGRAETIISNFEAIRGTDPNAQAKHDLKMYLADHEMRCKQARQELTRLEALPTVEQQFLSDVAQLEHNVHMAAHELLGSLHEAHARKIHDQAFKDLSDQTKREIRGRSGLQILRDYTSKAFVQFSLSENKSEPRARETVARVTFALKKLAELIKGSK